MKTLAVICIALTRQSPSLIPLLTTNFSTSGVMLTNSLLDFVLNVKYSVNDFIDNSENHIIKILSCRLRTQDPNHLVIG